MKKKIKTIIKNDFDLLAPYVIRDKGDIPPIIMFHFKNMNSDVQEAINETVNDDKVDVENGFFITINDLNRMKRLDEYASSIAGALNLIEYAGIASELVAMTFCGVGKGIAIKKNDGKIFEDEEVVVVTGVHADGSNDILIKELQFKIINTDKGAEFQYVIAPSSMAKKYIDNKKGENNKPDAMLSAIFTAYNTQKEKKVIDEHKELQEYISREAMNDPSELVATILNAVDARMDAIT